MEDTGRPRRSRSKVKKQKKKKTRWRFGKQRGDKGHSGIRVRNEHDPG